MDMVFFSSMVESVCMVRMVESVRNCNVSCRSHAYCCRLCDLVNMVEGKITILKRD